MKERDIRKWMLYFIYSIILFEVSIAAIVKQSAQKNEKAIDVLDNKIGARKLKDNDDSFKALLDSSSSKSSSFDFSDFPEAKFAEQPDTTSGPILTDQSELHETTLSEEVVTGTGKAKSRSLKKKKILDPELEDLLPNMDHFLSLVKPKANMLKKRSSSNIARSTRSKNDSEGSDTGFFEETKKFSNSCSEAEKLAGKCQNLSLVQPTAAENQKKLKAFESFNEEFMETQKISNRKLRERYLDETQEEMQESEKNHQAFLLYASNEYFKAQNRVWELEKEKYLAAQKENEELKIASIQKIIKATTKQLIKDFEAKQKGKKEARLKELKKKMQRMQNAYNQDFLRDHELINRLQGIHEANHPTFYSWKKQDSAFINKAIIQSL